MTESAIPPMTIEERIATNRDWYEQFGAESLIKQYSEYQQFMSNRCKELRTALNEQSGDQPEMVTITTAEYDQLVEDAEWLSYLEAAGVDNWEGIDEAISMRSEATNDE